MKVAILCHASAGGSGVVATELALALAGLGHTVHVVATERPFRLTEERLSQLGLSSNLLSTGQNPVGGLGRIFQESRKSVARWLGLLKKPLGAGSLHFHQVLSADYPLFREPLTPITAANSIAELIERYSIELVHAHYAIPHATSAILAREMGLPIKVVTTLHGTDVTLVGQEPAFSRTTRHAVRTSDAVTAVSHSLAQDARAKLGVEREIEVIYNWVDPERFKPNRDPAYRARFAQPEEAIVLHVSNFRSVKRPLDALRVFAGVAERMPARMLMIGEGPLRQDAIELAHELEIAGRVQFLESTPQIEKFMSVADLLLLPSEQESFGLVALEAMASGVPVVASRVGGLPELVEDGRTGFLCPVGDIQAMLEASLEILQSRTRRRNMGEAARERAVAHFRPEVVLPRYLEVYEKTLEGVLTRS
ncbi:MAG: N-acetyl-alpha-D-glucosaminyl L-malate synthase BshA [Meiothermus sp.]|uniref:N-acetyl-alpha-D-glucosaminyl L-malate synthase BshA n=1 Tax=Meiothermus sp. TaxID=1955249 RepID=UPI0025DD3732|nr:N-acetyl-alpha-D-glucosaminyl L-malate synthase BshA [Meiothermus sp.]MCS7058849.1 N-acetyl-alpha-D-glucosaminyl L-malate synthase BshA [Meiothermus sp.]MCS7194551.1 N-acetyl-alpha-D-glucosaminyl L-malate synthase BshA [Meiothermus sp.]MCX7740347.1 N-acetyl-alpha-D-glucosaminyl L-malate synthase BshA [Meiothermus sp.]MDW8091807.1 N-acetyl-alpha-D-glucosaminyl L-malate synthase BshA [Meiothermus sp.]MDW8482081.1 N-acetyl-alpha-D-glucosaminyl L-malate synthase BshA [Meiothermus sp.]